MGYKVAIVGATGAVGREMLKILEERNFPVGSIRLFASPKSEGEKLEFKEERIKVEVLEKSDIRGSEIALFSAGGKVSEEYAPKFVETGCVVIDNSSKWRMEKNVPLVVPEVNPQDAYKHEGIIANPNCSTIQLVVALKPICDVFGIDKVHVATYQSVSGSGKKGIDELHDQAVAILNFKEPEIKHFPKRIAFNLFPWIGNAQEGGYTQEEMKMTRETKKIMGDPMIKVTATCVRVPVFISHSEAVFVEMKKPATPDEVKEVMKNTPGIVLMDDDYPIPFDVAGTDEVYVGRIRQEIESETGIAMWVVADNLRKGAALNAVQIAELLVL